MYLLALCEPPRLKAGVSEPQKRSAADSERNVRTPPFCFTTDTQENGNGSCFNKAWCGLLHVPCLPVFRHDAVHFAVSGYKDQSACSRADKTGGFI